VLHAIERFHATYPDVILELNVSRHPYSFLGDQRSGTGSMAGYDAPLTQTWHDALLGYMGNNPVARDQAERAMAVQGASAGLNLDFGVLAQWQPVESQRLLLWAGRFGLQEEFMSALNKRHFEQRQSASARSTLLDAAREVGLDVAAAVAFLDSRELEDVVWKSYGQTIHEKKIHSIPLFALSVPSIGAVGGPFRPPGKHEAYVVRGSMDEEYFFKLFQVILRDHQAGERIYDERSQPYRLDEWRSSAPGRGTCST
jgi:predicted DsbA family dithiol-disulfide isomerase